MRLIQRIVADSGLQARLLGIVGGYITIYAFVLTIFPADGRLSALQTLLLVAPLALLALSVVAELRSASAVTFFKKSDAAGILGALASWMDTHGELTVYTRDLSVADDPAVKDLLLRKARNEGLTICLPRETPKLAKFLHDLEQEGARVIKYSALGYEPMARFTLMSFGQPASGRMTVGKVLGDRHINEEVPPSDPMYWIAIDLIAALRALDPGKVRVADGHQH
jgi:hypothetical protein